MRIKQLLFCVFIFIYSFLAKAQEINLPQYLNYIGENQFMITPAYVGIGTKFRVRMNGLTQWLGVKNAPNTQLLSLESRLTDKLGGGLVVFRDANGNTSQQGFKGTFAYHLILSELNESFLSFGLSYSLIDFNINTSAFEDLDAGLAGDRNLTTSNFDVSMLYRFNGYSLSFFVSNILNKRELFFSNGEPLVLRRYSLYNSFILLKSSGDVEIEPSILVEYFESDKRSRTDLNLKIRKRTKAGYIWAGFTYNFLNDQTFAPNTFAPLVGIKTGSLYASYGFGLNFNETQNFSSGSHLFTIGFDISQEQSSARCTQKYYMFQ